MGEAQDRLDQIAMGRHDPVLLARARLLDHVADLDEATAALLSGDTAGAASLVAEVVGALHDELFPHLPDGRCQEEQDLAPLP